MVEGSSVSPADPNPDVPLGSVARRDWWKSAVVYQVYPRSFADSDGDGVGDLGGILDHLDHLERLGVDVVWLSPVYRSPMVDNGYDISDYDDVDPLFGTLEQLEELIAQAARAGHETGDGSRRQPHQLGARLVRGVALVDGQPQARLVLVALPAARSRARVTGVRADQLGLGVFGPGVDLRRPRPASTTCTCSPPTSPTSTGRTRRCGRRSMR